jgi:anti-sigma factor (TIGR02949 family)
MNSCCTEHETNVQLYVDGELTGDDREEFLAHLARCAECTAAVRDAESFSRLVRSARSSVVAPESLRNAVLKTIERAEINQTGLKPVARRTRSVFLNWSIAAAAAIMLVAIACIPVLRESRQNQAEAMLQTAMLAHQQLSNNALPLDISSDSPQTVAEWFQNRVQFRFRMANSGIASNLTARYKLMGGRLVTVNNESVALVAFSVPHGVVTLLVGPERLMKASGGTVVESGGIALHSHDQGPLHIVTWNTQGLSYVLTSSRPEGSKQTCATCHEESSPETKSNPSAKLNELPSL